MSKNCTPTERDLRRAYTEAAGATPTQEPYYAEQVAEFERGIARIKAEAWDEGWFTAADEARGDVWFPAWGRQANPYREETGL